jgi:hypothetical protein
MSLKTAQVLRSKVPGLRTREGAQLPVGTRVRVMSSARETIRAGREQVKVKVEDPALPLLANQIIVASPGAFRTTTAGRPVGS